jgi:sugar/nucleoside kinase (ribokinase family)
MLRCLCTCPGYHNDPNLVAAIAHSEREHAKAMAYVVARDSEIVRLRAELEDARVDAARVAAAEELVALLTGRRPRYVVSSAGEVVRSYLPASASREDAP